MLVDKQDTASDLQATVTPAVFGTFVTYPDFEAATTATAISDGTNGVNAADTSNAGDVVATATTDAIIIKHTGFLYDAATTTNKSVTAADAADHVQIKVGSNVIAVLHPGEAIIFPRPVSTTFDFAMVGNAVAVEVFIAST